MTPTRSSLLKERTEQESSQEGESCIKDDQENIFRGGENSVEEKQNVKWIHHGAEFLRSHK